MSSTAPVLQVSGQGDGTAGTAGGRAGLGKCGECVQDVVMGDKDCAAPKLHTGEYVSMSRAIT